MLAYLASLTHSLALSPRQQTLWQFPLSKIVLYLCKIQILNAGNGQAF